MLAPRFAGLQTNQPFPGPDDARPPAVVGHASWPAQLSVSIVRAPRTVILCVWPEGQNSDYPMGAAGTGKQPIPRSLVLDSLVA